MNILGFEIPRVRLRAEQEASCESSGAASAADKRHPEGVGRRRAVDRSVRELAVDHCTGCRRTLGLIDGGCDFKLLPLTIVMT